MRLAIGMVLGLVLPLAGRAQNAANRTVHPTVCMPRAGDYTHMWWAEGFPSHTPNAPWLRVVQTGHYAMALDTETLTIPHLGPVSTNLGYAGGATAGNSSWEGLPPAELVLTISEGGKEYRCRKGGKWTQFGGPRLIESGRFMQRADVTNLVFAAEDGSRLNVEARFETVAWPDRLALIFAARPGQAPVPAGEDCFGRVGGGFGFDGTNHLEVPHAPELEPEQLTLELWAFVPANHRVSKRTYPWVVGKSGSEWVDGNYGIMLPGGKPRAVVNIGGGRENMFTVDAQKRALRIDKWNHLAMSYDGDMLRLYLNGKPAGERKVGRKRVLGDGPLAFGRRQDNAGDGYHFRGVLDEIRLYDRALSTEEVSSRAKAPAKPLASARPVRQWSFRSGGQAADAPPATQWRSAALGLRLKTATGEHQQQLALPADGGRDWQEVAVVLTPGKETVAGAAGSITVEATELPKGGKRPVEYDAIRGWHRVDLDGIDPIVLSEEHERRNDGMERIKLVLTNPGTTERVARLLFAKERGGIRQRIGSPITGLSAILRDAEGNPTGIPVQLSKNWHSRPEGGVYASMWFHGFSQVRLPPGANVELELTIVYGHWGGVAAASHAQLCLIGWGSNQLWEESALGAWGESICYEPDQAQGGCTVLDVRPVMVGSKGRNAKWAWTNNVGGGDFFRIFDPAGNRLFPARMKTSHIRQCPVLTEVLYAGQMADGKIEQRAAVSLYRTNDLVRGTYRLRLDVKEAIDFSRFVICQIGADTYSYSSERKLALGNEDGLIREWDAQWGGGEYKMAPMKCAGKVPWVSLHQAVSRPKKGVGAWANRGIVIRDWQARLGGKEAAPWVAEYGVKARGRDTSSIDIVPPPGVTRLLPGDYVEATVEHVIMPQFARDYYGPNEQLRSALAKDGNTWRMIHREALGNDRQVEVTTGVLESRHPAIRVRAEADRATFAITGGLGYVPITIAGLRASRNPRLETREPDGDWLVIDQSVHGSDFWQTDYVARSATWEVTFSVPSDSDNDQLRRREYRFHIAESATK